MNLEHFGRTLRELREGRGLTQDEVIQRTRAYSDARNLRNLEAGGQRPRRNTIILLFIKGLEEKNVSTINSALEDAGYEGLRPHEVAQLGLTPPPGDPELEKIGPALKPPAISQRLIRAWRFTAIFAIIAGVVASAVIQNPFICRYSKLVCWPLRHFGVARVCLPWSERGNESGRTTCFRDYLADLVSGTVGGF